MEPAKKIIMFAENYQFGGLERTLSDIANALSDEAYYVEIVHNGAGGFSSRLAEYSRPAVRRRTAWWLSTDGMSGEIDRFSIPQPVKILLKAPLVVLRYLFFPINICLLFFQLGAGGADVFHIIDGGYPGSASCQAAAIAAKLSGARRIIFSVLSMPAKRKIPLADNLLDALTSRCADTFVPNCFAAGEQLALLRAIPKNKIVPVYTGMDKITKTFDAKERENFRKKISVGNGDALICFAAAFEPLKGHSDLLNAFADLRKSHPNARLALVGDGKTRQRMEKLANDLNISQQVIFAGYYPPSKVLEWIDASDVVAFPSLWEGLPYSITEAMLAGKPIAAASVGGVPEQIENGVSGLLVPPSSPSELRDALARLIDEPDFAARLGRGAKRRAEEKFSLKTMVRELKKAYFAGIK